VTFTAVSDFFIREAVKLYVPVNDEVFELRGIYNQAVYVIPREIRD